MNKSIRFETAAGSEEEGLTIPAAFVGPFIKVLEDADAALLEQDAERRVSFRNDQRTFARQRAAEDRLARRARLDLFPAAAFGEPAWDILILLFAKGAGLHLTVTQVAEMIGTPISTTIRWIEYLEGGGLLLKERHKLDRRTTLIGLTDVAESRLTTFFCRPMSCEKHDAD